jgi:Kef-type K+ transport system membrane component KefB
MLLVGVALFLLIRGYGEGLTAPAPIETGTGVEVTVKKADVLLQVLVALTAIIVAGQLLARLFKYLGQPPVIGEVVAGILLGPSLLGPELSAFVLAPAAAPFLGVIAQLGVILYMFLVGLELNADLLKRRAHAVVVISHTSILVPFLMGSLLALILYPRLSSSAVPFTNFALFLGVAMSITAFPVLARILTDQRLHRAKLGVVALSCAAIDDVTAWCLLAFVIGVAQAQVSGVLVIGGWTLAYLAVMVVVVRPLLVHFVGSADERQLTRTIIAAVFIGMLLSALATEFIGIHAIFGAFLLGAVIPHDSAVAKALTRKLEELVTIILLPAFFAFSGMRTQINLLAGLEHWLLGGLIILIATLGKFGGTTLAARWTGLGWHDAAALGILMNTRGLMELIVLNVGLDLKVISPTLFAMMVLMALVTTLATTPVLHFLVPRCEPESKGDEAAGSS